MIRAELSPWGLLTIVCVRGLLTSPRRVGKWATEVWYTQRTVLAMSAAAMPGMM